MESIELLKRVKIFSGLTDEQLEKFSAVTIVENYPPRTVIIEEGAEGKALYIVQRGQVSVSKLDGDTERELVKLKTGEHFGEMSMIEDVKTSARVSAINDVDCLVIGRGAFRDLLESDCAIAAIVYRNFVLTLSERLRQTSRELSAKK